MPGPRRTDPALLQRLSAERVLELTPDIAVVTDYEGTILFANAALEKRLGVPVDELVGELVGDFLHPEDRIAAVPA